MKERCEFCGSETELCVANIPVCASCDNGLAPDKLMFLAELLCYKVLSAPMVGRS